MSRRDQHQPVSVGIETTLHPRSLAVSWPTWHHKSALRCQCSYVAYSCTLCSGLRWIFPPIRGLASQKSSVFKGGALDPNAYSGKCQVEQFYVGHKISSRPQITGLENRQRRCKNRSYSISVLYSTLGPRSPASTYALPPLIEALIQWTDVSQVSYRVAMFQQ